MTSGKSQLIVVLGDVHHLFDLTYTALSQIEAQRETPIAQIFSVGDFDLFMEEEDWDYMTGPAKYRHPEHSQMIREVWNKWHWPTTMIGGNHEPFHKLRKNGELGEKLQYTDCGILPCSIPQLRVYGLSGIYHPQHLDWFSKGDREKLTHPLPANWKDIVAKVEEGVLGKGRLTYFKEDEVRKIKALPVRPHLTASTSLIPFLIDIRYK